VIWGQGKNKRELDDGMPRPSKNCGRSGWTQSIKCIRSTVGKINSNIVRKPYLTPSKELMKRMVRKANISFGNEEENGFSLQSERKPSKRKDPGFSYCEKAGGKGGGNESLEEAFRIWQKRKVGNKREYEKQPNLKKKKKRARAELNTTRGKERLCPTSQCEGDSESWELALGKK